MNNEGGNVIVQCWEQFAEGSQLEAEMKRNPGGLGYEL